MKRGSKDDSLKIQLEIAESFNKGIVKERDRLLELVNMAETWLKAEDVFTESMSEVNMSSDPYISDEYWNHLESSREKFRKALDNKKAK